MLFLGKYGPKNQKFCFKLKLSTLPYLDMQVSVVMFTFSIFDRKYSFWSKKIKIVSSISWYLVPRRIWICKIPWWCSLFCFRTEIPFLGKFSLKIKIVSLSWNLVHQMCRIQWWCSILLFWTGNVLFGQVWSKKSKFSV